VTDREQFEEFMSGEPFHLSVTRFSSDAANSDWPGSYRDIEVDLAWQAWRKAREDIAGVWVDVKERMPRGYGGMVTCWDSGGFARELEWYDGRFSFWEDGHEAFPTHWLDQRPPGKTEGNNFDRS